MKTEIKIARLEKKIDKLSKELEDLTIQQLNPSEEYMEAAQPVVNRGAMLNDS